MDIKFLYFHEYDTSFSSFDFTGYVNLYFFPALNVIVEQNKNLERYSKFKLSHVAVNKN